MIVGDRVIAVGRPPYVIAEIGVNHDGLLEKANALVDAAVEAGADAVKVQWFEAERLVSRRAKLAVYQARSGAVDPLDMLGALELDAEQIAAVAAHTHARGLHAIATLFSVEHVPAAGGLALDAFKTASPDVVHRPLLEAIHTKPSGWPVRRGSTLSKSPHTKSRLSAASSTGAGRSTTNGRSKSTRRVTRT